MKRAGKLNGSLFLDLLVFNSDSLKDESLNDLSSELRIRHGIEIRKQSLHERFNRYALVFLKVALEELLQQQLNIDLCLDSRPFGRILIKDSTCFQIDESLEAYYPGSGGSGSGASVRIQFEYDLLTGKINDLSVNAFNEQDASDSIATIERTSAGDLIIRDLAYMSLDVLREIVDRSAFYLCRPSPSVHIYEKKGDKYCQLDFAQLTKHMKKHNLESIEKDVYLGSKDKFKTRLVLHLLPPDVVSRRIRKARETSRNKGRGDLTKEYIARAHLNLFVTNAAVELLSARNTWNLYRLRWQIELIFKVWKSICRIDNVKKVKRYRLECYIYAKLILIVLGWQILWQTSAWLYHAEGKVMSILKSAKTLFRKHISALAEIFLFKTRSARSFMNDFCNLSRSNHLLEKRREQPTSFELLLSFLEPSGLGAEPPYAPGTP